MKNNDLRLQINQLTNERLLSLFRMSLSVTELEQHDLLGFVRNTANTGCLLQLLIKRATDEADGNISLQKLDDIAHKLQDIADATFESIRTLFAPYHEFELGELFISRPQYIIDNIKKMRAYPEVIVSEDTPVSLELIFPGNILFGILSELISNAGRLSQNNGKVLIQWGTKSKKFQCEVHDNGPGIIPIAKGKFVPLDAIPLTQRKGGGLGIIDRIINRANGLLLFSNSKMLGGSLVYFEFPVIGFNK
jgi:signal transduction histidine kinase